MTDDMELTSAERAGFVNAHLKDSDGVYRLALHEADALLAAWTNGQAFFTGANFCGARTTLKLALVEGVVVWTADDCARAEENSAEERARDRARRMVEGEV